MDIVERLDWLCTDWDRSQMVDGEPPLDDVRVGDLRKAAAEITRLRNENAELKSQIVMECNEDEVPTFNQGLIEHELLEVVTAKRLDTLVALVVSLRARLEEAEAANADAWDEAMKAAAKRADEGFYQSCCGKGTIHGCCGSPDMFWENPDEIAAAIRDLVNPYRSKTDD